MHLHPSDVPCSSTTLGDEISLVNPEELIGIRTGAKLSDLSKCGPKDAKEAVPKAKQVNINIATRKEEYV